MYAEIKQIIARKNDSPPGSLQQQQQQNAPTPLDAVQLTSILSASGFHLDHFDIDRSRRRGSTSDGGATGSGAGDVLVEITCQRSGIVSRMHHAPARCTCPDEDECTRRSAIWDVQGAGGSTTAGFTDGSTEASVKSSSNLLPQLSPRKVQITKHLIKVMLDVFEAPDENGNVASAKSHMANNNNNDIVPNFNGALSPLPTTNSEHTNGDHFKTPVSSLQITPMKPDDFVAEVVGLPKVLLNNSDIANGSIGQNNNNLTFKSPGSDLFTSSPNTTPSQIRALPVHERDQVVASLRQIRLNIDNTLALLDFDSTRNITTTSAAIDGSLAHTGPAGRPAAAASAKAAATRTAASRILTQMPASGAATRRHSLSVMPGGPGAGVRNRLPTIPAAESNGRASTGGSATAMRKPADGAGVRRTASTAKVGGAKVATPTQIAHVATPRPPTARNITPMTRISLVARNSTSGGGVGGAGKASSAVSVKASDVKTQLQRSSLTRSLTRLPGALKAAAASATASAAAAAAPTKTPTPTPTASSGPSSVDSAAAGAAVDDQLVSD